MYGRGCEICRAREGEVQVRGQGLSQEKGEDDRDGEDRVSSVLEAKNRNTRRESSTWAEEFRCRQTAHQWKNLLQHISGPQPYQKSGICASKQRKTCWREREGRRGPRKDSASTKERVTRPSLQIGDNHGEVVRPKASHGLEKKPSS